MFHNLSLVESEELLSVSWLSKLLDVFLSCQEQFRVILSKNKSNMNKQALERSISDYFERSVKSLDVCNAIRDGIDQMRQWKRQLEIVMSVFATQKTLGEYQFQRAKRALKDLGIKIVDDEKESSSNLAQRNRSFNLKKLRHQESKCLKHSKSFSWSVSTSWSASKQLQAIGNSIVVPKSSDIIATNGLVLTVYTMSQVLNFVMWALVAAIPCQDRGLQPQSIISKNFAWGVPILSLQEKILEESKKRDRKNSCGLLKEIHGIEMFARYINGVDLIKFPLIKEHEEQVMKRFEELRIVFESLENGLDPLERQVRNVFHQIVRCRIEGIDLISRTRD
ncbi:BYPASS-related protein [Tanacetum coccineum]